MNKKNNLENNSYSEAKIRFYKHFYPEKIDELGNIKYEDPKSAEYYEEVKQRFYKHFSKYKVK